MMKVITENISRKTITFGANERELAFALIPVKNGWRIKYSGPENIHNMENGVFVIVAEKNV